MELTEEQKAAIVDELMGQCRMEMDAWFKARLGNEVRDAVKALVGEKLIIKSVYVQVEWKENPEGEKA